MKFYRNAIILIVIVALLGVAYYFVSKNAPKDENDVETIVITDIEADDIDTMTFKGPEYTFEMVVEDSKWVLKSPADIIYDQSTVSTMCEVARSVSAERVVEENASDLSVYGLQKPAVTVEIKLRDGNVTILEVGDELPVGSGRYAKLGGENKVYTIRQYDANKLLTDRNGIKKKALFDFDSETVSGLTMDRDGQNVFKARYTEDDGWEMYEPIIGSADPTALDPMAASLAALRVSEFIEEHPADLSKYGLDSPRYAFEITSTEGGTFKLLLGKERNRGEDIYAMLEGRDEVFTLGLDDFFFLDKPIDELFSVFAYIVDISEVKEIDLTMDGKTTHMTLDVYMDEEGNRDNSKDKFTVNGKDASGYDENGSQPFRKFYQALVGVTLDDIDLEGQPSGEPEITIEYKLKDGTTMRVDFVSRDEYFYYVLRNGEYAKFIVRKNKGDFGVRGLRESYRELMDFLGLN